MRTTRIALLGGAILAAGLVAFAAAGGGSAAGAAGCKHHKKRCAKQAQSTTTTSTTTATKTAAKTSSSATATSGSVTLVDKPFICSGPVNLTSVSVTIKNVSKDAVYLRKGCTGTIGRIDVVQYKGDGIKVNAANDLVIGGGSVRCYGRSSSKHQDGVQVQSGSNITIRNLDVGCYSANNSQVWINDGTGTNPPPTNVVFEGGRFQGYYDGGRYGPGGAYGFAIVHSLASGVRNATICPNKVPKRALYIGSSAESPVTSGTKVETSC